MKWPGRTAVAVCVAVGLASPAVAGQVKLDIRNGLVTLDARDATLREILAEWARVGRTRIVNGESVLGGPMTVQLNGVPERNALETLLRASAGYLAAPRAVPEISASMYDRIMVMPGLRPAVVPASTASTPSASPRLPVTRDRALQPPAADTDEENEDPGMPPGAVPGNNPYGPGPAGSTNSPVLGGSPRPLPPTPQPAPQPGMQTPPPSPIKGPGGDTSPGR